MNSKLLMIIKALVCIILMQICVAGDLFSKEDDKIVSLPGQPQVSFQQYAGYVTIDEKQRRALFYYFVEAESEPASKPFVLWLTGGPGCSSVGAGAFSGHGPFRTSDGENLSRHEYSWNKEANMLYVESPAGVGFSYSANASFYDSVNDTITGHYVPQLAKLIARSGLKFNLKSIAIGNPLLDFNTDMNSRGDYYWSHGLISDPTYKLVTTICNTSQLAREQISGSSSVACKAVNAQLSKEIPDAIDNYDVSADVCVSYGQSQLKVYNRPLRPRFHFPLFSESLEEGPNQPKSAENIDVCVQPKTLVYLNRKDVREALHAQLVGVSNWSFCSQVLNYDLKNLEIPMIDVVGSLVSSGISVLVYSGDQDSVVPFAGSRTLVNGLAKKLSLNATVTYRPWFQNKQVGGWTQVYGETLTFTTIRGGSHLAPLSSPKRSLAVFKAFLAGNPLA
ncbi:serine carboxypeptidase-like 45 isoform X2 [Hevea brasiliensis]|uniref:serine carboxypeptidase-like 45 isoform X2 n=1 Tax=Hevea brasiliensis TaxID=3981 RepID=UPI0025F3D396|nr:serine carboxypeptidase-like 45 isoform X2 [Hevea brasiliensis]